MNESEILACAGKIAASASDPQNIVPQDEWDYEGLPSPEWHRAEMMNGSLEMAGEAAEDAEALLADDNPAYAAERLKDAEILFDEYLWFKSLSDTELQKHFEGWYAVEQSNGAFC